MTLRVETLSGEAMFGCLGDLAALRIRVFAEYPYLYQGRLDYEARYMDRFAKSPGAVIVACFDGDRVVGAATAAPMASQKPEISKPLAGAGYEIGRTFYFGESVLLPEYRGRGIGHAFFDGRERAAREHPGITHACFLAVIRPDDHPAKPAGYSPLHAFWEKRGYAKIPALTALFSWPDIGESRATEKPMQYWMHKL